MQIVKVKYISETTGKVSEREYTYFSEDELTVGQIIFVPARDTVGKAMVSQVDIPESEVESFRHIIKTIPAQPKEKVKE